MYTTETERPESYALLYVDGWDHAAGEPLGGGRIVEARLPDLAEAQRALAIWAPVAPRVWGPGLLAIVNQDGALQEQSLASLDEVLSRAA